MPTQPTQLLLMPAHPTPLQHTQLAVVVVDMRAVVADMPAAAGNVSP